METGYIKEEILTNIKNIRNSEHGSWILKFLDRWRINMLDEYANNYKNPKKESSDYVMGKTACIAELMYIFSEKDEKDISILLTRLFT